MSYVWTVQDSKSGVITHVFVRKYEAIEALNGRGFRFKPKPTKPTDIIIRHKASDSIGNTESKILGTVEEFLKEWNSL